MDPQPLIRTAQVADARSIALVHVASSTASYRPLAREWKALDEEKQARKWEGWLEATRDDPTRVEMVAEVDGDVVGFATAGPARREDLETDLELYVIHVLPAHRGRGIGGRLWSAVCAEVRGTELRSLYVATYAELRCCSFYEARGGELVEREPSSYQGGEVTGIVYRWAEGQSSQAGPYALRTAGG
jgi:GNAT superfamily N-acetyltransferase